MILLCLAGEQPIPNLLPVRFLKPAQTLIAHTALDASRKSAQRLAGLTGSARQFSIGEGYQIPRILDTLRREIGEPEEEVVVNLTGGTKPMALAAFELARQRRYPMVYYQTEGPRGRDQKSKLYRYRFDEQGQLCLEEGYPCELPALITLDDYLKAHLDGYHYNTKQTAGKVLEDAIAQALKPHVDEIKQNVVPDGVKDQAEIDLLVRCGNHVGIFEIKTGGEGSGKKAVDQLTTIAAREYLGTYAARFMITQSSMEDRYKALAYALRVTVIELKEYRPGRPLSQSDARHLLDIVSSILPIRRSNG
ncbi:DUF1887 family CARF protein [Thermanaerothrix sp. 4228-RoL]|uniref:DUF1887 family CARF protein n=1 Tax=Thermanaerothrix solaris TaxID=3058434 RepID=A0ABU3NN65_9CHLR|nr:DUF1887 family CARF protein [Thermanaerothrix sp. 4228-RoL]MDT8897618.1 DUF1887 family CARF protein [Thermanaerothrix sp. 4228-RoL]